MVHLLPGHSRCLDLRSCRMAVSPAQHIVVRVGTMADNSTKRVVRRRVRKGTFSPTHSAHGSGSWPKFLSRRSNPTGPTSQNRASQLRDTDTRRSSRRSSQHALSQSQSMTASRLGERSILLELDAVSEVRRGSGMDSLETKVAEGSDLSVAPQSGDQTERTGDSDLSVTHNPG